ncbi:SurA N-terminal domain-containing protein [Pseudoteredinibacter isoporae]|uniref:SurA N-terminal domain-containing protein n=1 Tax=Pseudoteredinibacter isoporae TaxID=570281 RepID=UPI00310BC43B
MIQSFRNKLQGIFAVVLVVLISIPFVLFGVDSLFTTNSNQGEAAQVDGEAITDTELTRAIAMQKQQMVNRFGDQLPAEFLTDERWRTPVLEQLISQKLEIISARNNGVAVSDARIDQLLLAEEAFKIDGKFSPQVYRQRLASLGYTPASYKKVLQDELIGVQLRQGISLTAFATDAELTSTLVRAGQTRDFYFVTLPKDQFSEGAEPEQAAIDAEYENNSAQYMGPEQVKTQLVALSVDELAKNIDVAEDDVRAQHEQEISVFEGAERRRAAHILLEDLGEGIDQAKADEIQAKLDAGEAFEELAKTYSDDILTAEQGGDLGFTDGETFPDAFEAALASMQEGEVSQAVTTEAGVHFIKLLEIDAPEAPSYESMKDEIRERLVRDKAMAEFEELAPELEELAYNADDLSDVAAQLGLEMQSSEWLSRSGAEGLLAHPKVLEAVFSDQVLKDRQTSDPIELSDTQVAIVKVLDYKAPAVKPLDEVRDEIVAKLTAATILQRQQTAAKALEEAVAAGGDLEALAKEKSFTWNVVIASRKDNFKVEQQLLKAAFAMKATSFPAFDELSLANGDLQLIQLNGITELSAAEVNKNEKQQLSSQLEQAEARRDFSSFQEQLRADAEIEIFDNTNSI